MASPLHAQHELQRRQARYPLRAHCSLQQPSIIDSKQASLQVAGKSAQVLQVAHQAVVLHGTCFAHAVLVREAMLTLHVHIAASRQADGLEVLLWPSLKPPSLLWTRSSSKGRICSWSRTCRWHRWPSKSGPAPRAA